MIVIIGGGPAGLAASLAAAQSGAKVLLIESGPRLGGQYWRHLPEDGSWANQEKSHHDFQAGALLRSAVANASNIEILISAHVWHAEFADGEATLYLLAAGAERKIKTRALILATGAYDRALPFPGWDIPGVMTPGGAQALLKGNFVRAGKRVVVAGTGPFLLTVAAGLAEAGAEIVALLDANRLTRWLPRVHIALANFSKLKEGAGYFRTFSKHGIRQERGYTVIAAHAGVDGTLRSVTVAKVDRNFKTSKTKEIECDCLAIGWGFTADLSLASNLGLSQEAVAADESVIVSVDDLQQTNLVGVFAAGEITGIGGSQLSLTEGRIAGFAAAAHLGLISQTQLQKLLRNLLSQRKKERKFASALISSYPVKSGWQQWLESDTVICRCEEVYLSDIKNAVHELGATDSRTAKLFTRTGMGMCQGRVCGRAVIDIVANESGINPTIRDRIAAGNRPVVTPIPLGVLANPTGFE